MDIVPVGSPSSTSSKTLSDYSNRESNGRKSLQTSSITVACSKSLVSEHEEEDNEEYTEEFEEGIQSSNNVARSNMTEEVRPAEIPLLEVGQEEEESSDYEYIYSDEENCHINFLQSDPILLSSSSVAEVSSSEDRVPQHSSIVPSSSPLTRTDIKPKSTWKEPSQAAVSMSLRAEQEKTGGRRRLASDLYKVMMGDTEEQGFSIEPSKEDNMEKWRIKLFRFDEDSNLHKDLMVLGIDHIELEMSFPDQYPFEPPFVRVVRPRFQKQTGFVMNGALCMELLTSQGWNPVNDIESVIVSIRSLIVVGDGRLSAAFDLPERKIMDKIDPEDLDDHLEDESVTINKKQLQQESNPPSKKAKSISLGHYTASEARSAYSHLSDLHAKKGWDSNGWWARKG